MFSSQRMFSFESNSNEPSIRGLFGKSKFGLICFVAVMGFFFIALATMFVTFVLACVVTRRVDLATDRISINEMPFWMMFQFFLPWAAMVLAVLNLFGIPSSLIGCVSRRLAFIFSVLTPPAIVALSILAVVKGDTEAKGLDKSTIDLLGSLYDARPILRACDITLAVVYILVLPFTICIMIVNFALASAEEASKLLFMAAILNHIKDVTRSDF